MQHMGKIFLREAQRLITYRDNNPWVLCAGTLIMTIQMLVVFPFGGF